MRIIDVNFKKEYEWIFKLIDEFGNSVFIMDSSFYNSINIKSPISKAELDCYDIGQCIDADIKDVNGVKVVDSELC